MPSPRPSPADRQNAGDDGRFHAGWTAIHRPQRQPAIPVHRGHLLTVNRGPSRGRLWEALTEGGGSPGQCGWIKDRFGVSWQIVPKTLIELLNDPDRERAGRVMEAMLQMTKINIDGLCKAHGGSAVALPIRKIDDQTRRGV